MGNREQTVIANRIKCARKAQQMTQEQLAEKLSVSRDLLARWEKSERSIRAEHLAELATALNVTSDYLLGLSSHEMSDIERAQISCDYLCISEEQLDMMKKLVTSLENGRKDETK